MEWSGPIKAKTIEKMPEELHKALCSEADLLGINYYDAYQWAASDWVQRRRGKKLNKEGKESDNLDYYIIIDPANESIHRRLESILADATDQKR